MIKSNSKYDYKRRKNGNIRRGIQTAKNVKYKLKKGHQHDSSPGRQTTQLKSGQRTWTDTSPKTTYRGPGDTWKDAQHH